MCQQVACSKCGKPTWSGCGFHKEQALAGVSKENRCPAWNSWWGCKGPQQQQQQHQQQQQQQQQQEKK
uniref:Uncharacterized protein n=1 Tax=Chromera velia CCMP2878 TaxID=1169474 RepID=A0A0G4I5N6_9ALVE|eukprot:Cvel_11150.t1-p1 / transcript=Cvel_11150.t1 / gene=Cvel_11150 / organism=Chromera_velia_CCMP2878 / gene_product=hypothetical protein / transcript_product=hypothetical protein / location=Cvel_scaffold691:58193-59122(+) / protein_length=67 / sequence_SO=supercontig / SO=protein_coding / is_pseudo=false